MNKIKRIILDVDHTITKSDEAFIKAYSELYNVKPLGFETKKWDFTDCLPDIDKSLIMPTFASDLFFEFLQPYPHVVEEVEKIRRMGIEVIIASQCSPQSVGKKAQWIDKHFPNICQYPKIGWGKDKSYLALGEGDLFIDDMPKVLDSVSTEYKIMFKGVDGRDWQQDNEYSCINDWEDFSMVISDYNSYCNLITNLQNGMKRRWFL